MILSFSKHGKGQGFGPVKYVCDETKPNGEKRSVKPEILRGDADETIALIDANKNSWKYTSLVISFTKEEFDDLLAEQVLDEFEKFAFANLDKNDYSFLAVLHKDTDNPHIHIICPRTNLTTGTDLNIAPKQQQKQWHFWSDYVRDKYNLKAIDNNNIDKSVLTKAEKMSLSKNNLSTHSKAKIELDSFIKKHIEMNFIRTRQDMKKLLEDIDIVEKVELKQNSISIKLKTHNKNIRLEGGIYATITTTQQREFRARYSDSFARHERKEIERTIRSDQSEAHNKFRTEYKKLFDSRARQFKERFKNSYSRNTENTKNIFSISTKENKKTVINNTRSKHFDKFNSICNNNISSVKALTQNKALTNSVSDTIANLEQKLLSCVDEVERVNILNQLSDLLNVKYEQQRKLKF
ncbi:relaxase/mobilization nuclease domain-containing protein [Hydrogenophaga sp.]|uniref:relaxase/mobilization nuclease domain-containing protein n=1 Tax=Hydrogenophaga sp. TaxID=1904254 RepID=UPI0035B2FC04